MKKNTADPERPNFNKSALPSIGIYCKNEIKHKEIKKYVFHFTLTAFHQACKVHMPQSNFPHTLTRPRGIRWLPKN